MFIVPESSISFKSIDQFNMAPALILPVLFWFGDMFSNFTLSHPKTRHLMDTRSFDLVIVEIFCTEAFIGFGQHFNAPVVAVSTFGASKWTNDLVGTPSPLSYVPHAFSTFSDKMSLWGRTINTVLTVYENCFIHTLNYPLQVGTNTFHSYFLFNYNLSFTIREKHTLKRFQMRN